MPADENCEGRTMMIESEEEKALDSVSLRVAENGLWTVTLSLDTRLVL